MTPDALIARVRAALGRTADAPLAPPPPVPPAWSELVARAGAPEGLVDRFVSAARAVGLEVRRVPSAAVAAEVALVLAEVGARRVAYAADCGLPQAGQGLVTDPVDAFGLEAGVTGVVAAVAQSGAVLVASGPGAPGLVSLAPPLHIAVVRAGQVVGSVADALARPPSAAGAAEVFIAGPSKTADIEGVLVTGVHGPGRVVVVISDGD